ncbi:hypothetical protein DFS34DRAFT_669005 [Phlyctochytrium arcticum]|nr:hypothetical protein DFS34DRAFT_669005 [Phlyctochytrium arcticum]
MDPLKNSIQSTDHAQLEKEVQKLQLVIAKSKDGRAYQLLQQENLRLRSDLELLGDQKLQNDALKDNIHQLVKQHESERAILKEHLNGVGADSAGTPRGRQDEQQAIDSEAQAKATVEVLSASTRALESTLDQVRKENADLRQALQQMEHHVQELKGVERKTPENNTNQATATNVRSWWNRNATSSPAAGGGNTAADSNIPSQKDHKDEPRESSTSSTRLAEPHTITAPAPNSQTPAAGKAWWSRNATAFPTVSVFAKDSGKESEVSAQAERDKLLEQLLASKQEIEQLKLQLEQQKLMSSSLQINQNSVMSRLVDAAGNDQVSMELVPPNEPPHTNISPTATSQNDQAKSEELQVALSDVRKERDRLESELKESHALVCQLKQSLCEHEVKSSHGPLVELNPSDGSVMASHPDASAKLPEHEVQAQLKDMDQQTELPLESPQIELLTNALEELRTERDKQKQEIELLTSTLQSRELELAAAIAAVTSAKDTAHATESKVRDQMNALQSQIDQKQNQIVACSEKLQELQETLHSTREKVIELETSLSAQAMSFKISLETQEVQKVSVLRVHQEEIDSLQTTIREQHGELEKLQREAGDPTRGSQITGGDADCSTAAGRATVIDRLLPIIEAAVARSQSISARRAGDMDMSTDNVFDLRQVVAAENLQLRNDINLLHKTSVAGQANMSDKRELEVVAEMEAKSVESINHLNASWMEKTEAASIEAKKAETTWSVAVQTASTQIQLLQEELRLMHKEQCSFQKKAQEATGEEEMEKVKATAALVQQRAEERLLKLTQERDMAHSALKKVQEEAGGLHSGWKALRDDVSGFQHLTNQILTQIKHDFEKALIEKNRCYIELWEKHNSVLAVLEKQQEHLHNIAPQNEASNAAYSKERAGFAAEKQEIIGALESQLQNMLTKHTEEVSALEKHSRAELEDQVQRATSASHELLKEKQLKIDELETLIRTLQQQLHNSEGSDKTRRERVELEDKLRKEQKEKQKYVMDYEKIKKDSAELQKRLEKDIMGKSEELGAALRKSKAFEAEILASTTNNANSHRDHQAKCELLSKQLEEKHREIVQLRSFRDKAENEYGPINARLAAELEMVKANLEVSAGNLERMHKQLSEKDDTIRSIKAKVDDLVYNETNLRKDISKLEKDKAAAAFAQATIAVKMSGTHEEQAIEMSKIKDSNSRLLNEISALGEQHSNQAAENQRLQLKIRQIENEAKISEKKNNQIVKDLQKQLQKERRTRGSSEEGSSIAAGLLSAYDQSPPTTGSTSDLNRGKRPPAVSVVGAGSGADPPAMHRIEMLTDDLLNLAQENEALNKRLMHAEKELHSTNERAHKQAEELEVKSSVLRQYILQEHATILQPDERSKTFNFGILSSPAAMQKTDPILLSQINLKMQKLLEDMTTKMVKMEEQLKSTQMSS